MRFIGASIEGDTVVARFVAVEHVQLRDGTWRIVEHVTTVPLEESAEVLLLRDVLRAVVPRIERLARAKGVP